MSFKCFNLSYINRVASSCLSSVLRGYVGKNRAPCWRNNGFTSLYRRFCTPHSCCSAIVLLNLWSPGGVFFCQESFALQHASAIFEWVYCTLIMLFYGTFAFEFGGMSGDTLMVLSRGGGVQSFSTSEHKSEVGGGSNHHPTENLSML